MSVRGGIAATPLFATSLVVDTIAGGPRARDPTWRPLLDARDRERATGPATGEAWRTDVENFGLEPLFARVRAHVGALARRVTINTAHPKRQYDWNVRLRVHVALGPESIALVRAPDAFWSGLYFADDGYANSMDPALSGELALEDPRVPMTLMEASLLRLRSAGTHNAPLYSEEVITRPATGRALLYPAWLRAAFKPLLCEGPRIVFEMALVPRLASM